MSGCSEAATLRLEPDSFRNAAQLTSLAFTSARQLMLTADCLVGLTTLARLSIYDCGLVSIPPALEALGGSLTRLALLYNNALELTHGDVKVLLALHKLRTLDLRKDNLLDYIEESDDLRDVAYEAARAVQAKLHFTPSVWSNCSMQHLMELSAAYYAEHGRVLDARVDRKDTIEDDPEYDLEDDNDTAYWDALGRPHSHYDMIGDL